DFIHIISSIVETTLFVKCYFRFLKSTSIYWGKRKMTHMELYAPRRFSTCHSEPVEESGRKIEGRRVIKKYY
ncbi:MAG TPA: hypothetical protein PLI57_02650, partial [Spirochaetota bacterium]|nr:hypothetical protein [Spirochaetota bacterium]